MLEVDQVVSFCCQSAQAGQDGSSLPPIFPFSSKKEEGDCLTLDTEASTHSSSPLLGSG